MTGPDATGHDAQNRIARAFRRGLPSYHRAASVQAASAARLAGLLADHRARSGARTGIGRVFEFGCGTGLLTEALAARFDIGDLVLNDLVAEVAAHLPAAARDARFLPGPVETLALEGAFDLIASGATVQWVRDPAALLRRLAGHLAPGGYLLLGGFGRGHFAELSTLGVAPEGMSYHDPDEWPGLLPDGLTLCHAETRRTVLSFADLPHLLRHLRETGVTGPARARWHRAALREAETRWRGAHPGPEGGLALSYDSVHLLARVTDCPSQGRAVKSDRR